MLTALLYLVLDYFCFSLLATLFEVLIYAELTKTSELIVE